MSIPPNPPIKIKNPLCDNSQFSFKAILYIVYFIAFFCCCCWGAQVSELLLYVYNVLLRIVYQSLVCSLLLKLTNGVLQRPCIIKNFEINWFSERQYC